MVFTNKQGVQWYSHKVRRVIGRNKVEVDTYFFKKEKGPDYIEELPETYTVKETHTGLPIIKKIQ